MSKHTHVILSEERQAGDKKRIKVDVAMERIEAAVQPYPKAALFELAEEGYRSAFELLVACVISIRTLDETTLPTARGLFARGRTADEVASLSVAEIDALIHGSTFHDRKAEQIQAIARRVADRYHGELPCDRETLMSFSGVGIKCAHLVLGLACNQPYISVDVHVHRVTNRWGYVETSSPEHTTAVLARQLPRRYWLDINRLLVPFGKHICTGPLPHCSTCSVLEMCQQVGVTKCR